MADIAIIKNENHISVNGYKIYINNTLGKALFKDDGSPSEAIVQFSEMHKLPGLMSAFGLPDMHMGYHFPIGSVAVINLEDPKAVVSPEGVGYDINCGVRCLKTNLKIKNLTERIKNKLANALYNEFIFDASSKKDLIDRTMINGILDNGMKYLYEKNIIPKEDLEFTESFGSLKGNNKLVDQKSKSKGMRQFGTIGSGNHYLEIQVVEEICDKEKASVLGLEVGQILISIHTGSRGLGHGVCSFFLNSLVPQKRKTNNRSKNKEDDLIEENNSLEKKTEIPSSVNYNSPNGQKYMSLMASAANFAWANRSIITQKIRNVLKSFFPESNINVISDVSHNIAKVEPWKCKDRIINVLVHRKGASRILPPHHSEIPPKFANIGQPILIGGSMGTSSFIVTGGLRCVDTLYSSPHGAGRLVPRSKANNLFIFEDIKKSLERKNIITRCNSEKGLVEESPNCYKDIEAVVSHSEKMEITCSVVKLKPVIVIKDS